MAITAAQLAALEDLPWASIAKAAKQAMVSAAMGGSELTVNGKHIGRISVEDAKSLYNTAQEMIVLEGDGADAGNVIVRLGEEV
jgi:hypothetical protein